MITVRDGFGFLRCEERDEKDQLFFHPASSPTTLHPAPGDEFDFDIGTEAAGDQRRVVKARRRASRRRSKRKRESTERLRSIPTGTVKFEDEVAAELTGTARRGEASGGGGFVEAVWEGETVRARFQVRDIAEPKGCREGPATGSTLTFALWRARGPKKTLLARTLKLAVMAGTVDAIKGDRYSKSSFGFIRDVKFGGAGAGGGTGAAAKDAEAKAAAAKANEGRPIVDDAADGERRRPADGAAAVGEGAAAGAGGGAGRRSRRCRRRRRRRREGEGAARRSSTAAKHLVREAGGASLNVGDEVEFYAFVDKVKGRRARSSRGRRRPR